MSIWKIVHACVADQSCDVRSNHEKGYLLGPVAIDCIQNNQWSYEKKDSRCQYEHRSHKDLLFIRDGSRPSIETGISLAADLAKAVVYLLIEYRIPRGNPFPAHGAQWFEEGDNLSSHENFSEKDPHRILNRIDIHVAALEGFLSHYFPIENDI